MIDFVKRNELVVVDVFADWCGPCRSLAPRYEALAGKYINQAIFLKINLDDIDDADMKAEITALPTFFIFRNDGQRITKQKESGISVAQLESFIN
jgi:thioredoxin 1